MIQAFIALFGLVALHLAFDKREARRRVAPFVGLAGQPFWLLETWRLGATGMFVVSVACTAVYLAAAITWRPSWLRNRRDRA